MGRRLRLHLASTFPCETRNKCYLILLPALLIDINTAAWILDEATVGENGFPRQTAERRFVGGENQTCRGKSVVAKDVYAIQDSFILADINIKKLRPHYKRNAYFDIIIIIQTTKFT